MKSASPYLISFLLASSLAACQAKSNGDVIARKVDAAGSALNAEFPSPVFPATEPGDYIDAKLLRFPDVSEAHIVFSYASDLWLVEKTGGVATRLTTQDGEESNPKFSPGGQTISFTAPYADGNEDVYTMSIFGSVPKRLTYHPAYDYVLDWHPADNTILFRSDRESERARYSQLFTISADGGMPEKLPLPYGEMATYSPDGGTLLFSYLKDFQNQPDLNREAFKRYIGGRAPDIWSYNFASGNSDRMTSHERPDSAPMWSENGIYFLSEREDNRSNIFHKDSINGGVTQITQFTEDDITRPSLGPKDIVFEFGGGLARLDLASGDVFPVNIQLSADLYSIGETSLPVSEYITHGDITPDGQKIVFVTRGDAISLDPETGVFKTLSGGSHYATRYPVLSSDGKKLAYINDETGEYQLYIMDVVTRKKRQLTNMADGFLFKPNMSPDGKYIIFINVTQSVYLVNTETGRSTEIDKDMWRDFYSMEDFHLSWSKDSRWAIYAVGTPNRNNVLKLLNTQTRDVTALTSGYYNDHSPVFSEDGNYLFLLSERALDPVYGDIDTTWTYANSTVLAAVTLRKDMRSPLAPHIELPATSESIQIDIDGFEDRINILKPKSGNLSNLNATENGVSFIRRARAGSGGRTSALAVYDLSSKEEEAEVISGRFNVLDQGKTTALVKQGDDYFTVPLKAGASLSKPLPVSDFRVDYNRRNEARQIMDDARRFQRDFFYDPDLHGVDWNSIATKYSELADHVTTDSDLSFVLREMVGELSAGHVWAVAKPRVRYTYDDGGLLGADLEVVDGFARIKKILSAGPRKSEYPSPLDAPGLDIKAGDYILAINGRILNDTQNIWKAFEGLAGQTVELTYNSSPSMNGVKTVLIDTLKNERKLRELDWVEQNRQYVEKKSGGKLGYIYVPDTSRNGQNELMRQYRTQYTKKGLIIDGRFNSGGALGDRLVELLNRPPLVYFSVRNGIDYPLPEFSHHGPKAMIINGWSYSGGDGFPLLFKEAGVGPLIGTPTWGGLIGPAMSVPFVSGGRMAAPPQRVYNTRGEWAESHGVQPDIPVENQPGDLVAGIDAQLDAAIENVLSRLDDFPAHEAPEYVKKTP